MTTYYTRVRTLVEFADNSSYERAEQHSTEKVTTTNTAGSIGQVIPALTTGTTVGYIITTYVQGSTTALIENLDSTNMVTVTGIVAYDSIHPPVSSFIAYALPGDPPLIINGVWGLTLTAAVATCMCKVTILGVSV